MFEHVPSLKALHVFESAARHGSFIGAAEELAVSPGAVSYQIKQLEKSLSTPLFHRRTRQVVLTTSGEILFRAVHRQFQELDAAIAEIAPTRTAIPLTVSVSTYFVTRWLSPRLGKFLTSHPNITIRLQHSVNDPDFRVEDTDVAIKWGDGSWANSESELLLSLPMIAVCAPILLDGTDAIESIADLQPCTLLRDQSSTDYWGEWLAQAGVTDVGLTGPVIVDPNVRVQSAIDGQGIVLANALINDLIDDKVLCEPFDVRLEGYGYYLVYSHRAGSSSAFVRFRDWLTAELMAAETKPKPE